MAADVPNRPYKLMKQSNLQSPKETQRASPRPRVESNNDHLKRFINEQLARSKQMAQRQEKERVVLYDALRTVQLIEQLEGE